MVLPARPLGAGQNGLLQPMRQPELSGNMRPMSTPPDDDKGRRVRSLSALWPFLRPYRRAVAAALGFLLLSASASLVLPAAVGQMIDHGFSQTDAGLIDRYFVALFAVAAVLALATAGRFYFVSWLGERVMADLRRALFGHLLRQELGFFEQTRVGELQSRLTADTELIQTVVGSSASVALRSILLLLGALVLLVLTSPQLAMLIVIGIPAIVAPILLFGRRVQQLSRQSQDRLADTSAVAGEALGAIATVQAFAREEHERSRYGKAIKAALQTARKRLRMRAVLTALVILLVFGAVTLVLWFGAQAVLEDRMSPGQLSQFVLYAVMAASSTGALSEVWGDVLRAAGAMERILELLGRTPAILDPVSPATSARRVAGHLQFQQVSFRYPSRPEPPALIDFDLSVRPGETVALVGPSGAGKSTVLQLLLRHWEPEQGRIELDGVALDALPLAHLREQLALVPQDSFIFGASARDNIRYGRPDASAEEVEAAARAAEAHEFISTLPEGYDSYLGERGVRLSGGQRQRIAIARALLKDAPVLLLDEATSALDAQSEHAIQRALQRLMANRTTIVIAHRLATVQRADRIIVLDAGRIVAIGDHASLIAQGGLYAELAKLQFAA